MEKIIDFNGWISISKAVERYDCSRHRIHRLIERRKISFLIPPELTNKLVKESEIAKRYKKREPIQ